MIDFRTPVPFGQTGLQVSRLGIGSSFTGDAAFIEEAVDQGVVYHKPEDPIIAIDEHGSLHVAPPSDLENQAGEPIDGAEEVPSVHPDAPEGTTGYSSQLDVDTKADSPGEPGSPRPVDDLEIESAVLSDG